MRPARPLPSRRAMVGYGVRLGAAAAIAYPTASALGLLVLHTDPPNATYVAYLFAWLLPSLLDRRGSRRATR